MKSVFKVFALSGLVLIASGMFGACRTTAATHKHEFKKELHKVERAH